MTWIPLSEAVAKVIENCAEEYMKRKGIPLPGFRIDKKTGKPVRNVKALPAHKQIANRTKKTFKSAGRGTK